MSGFNYSKMVARGIADGFGGTKPDLEMFLDRMELVFGTTLPWMPVLFKSVNEAINGDFDRLNREELVEFIFNDAVFENAVLSGKSNIKIRQLLTPPESMRPAFESGAPKITDIEQLRTILGIPAQHLDWFADTFNKLSYIPFGPLQHYSYQWVNKKNGTARLIESPKYQLKEIQRSVLKRILEKIPVHDAVHGFVKNRSSLTGANRHTNSTIILKMDIRDFFLNIRFGRIYSFFNRVGYPKTVSRYLTGICTNVTPLSFLKEARYNNQRALPGRETLKKYNTPHLPQGAPSSPALSNLCMYTTDVRLERAALKYGAIYTRYADDLVFSGGRSFCLSIKNFQDLVYRIIHEEGFSINHRKTRVLKRGVRQSVCGIVVNQHTNIDRKAYDALKAQLYNCIRFGPESQKGSHTNYKEHLYGKIGYVHMLNPTRAEKLYALFNKISWG